MARTRFLLVEDNPGDVRLIRAGLEETGAADVDDVSSTAAASGYLETHETPDCLVLDVSLPGENGLEFLERIRRDPRFAELNVVMLSSSDRDRDQAAAKSFGVREYLVKPHDLAGYVSLGRQLVSLGANS